MNVSEGNTNNSGPSHPLLQLSAEDLNMVTAFILESGSIKALAKKYDVSYPTMRQRLDALIQRVQQLVDETVPDPLSNHLAELINQGRLTANEASHLRDLHRNILTQQLDAIK